MDEEKNQALIVASAVLHAAQPVDKVANAKAAMTALAEHPLMHTRNLMPELPARPARPEKPRLAAPSEKPKRRLNSVAGRAALLHAVAHIEFNAIDLAFDMALRFAADIEKAGLCTKDFVSDWFSVGADEARHFMLVKDRLNALGTDYGDLPAHDGLWEAAISTQDNALARLAIAPMVLEARGLDVTPPMIEKLISAGDPESADILKVIYEDEIGHVRIGRIWFQRLCEAQNLEPENTFRQLVRDRFAGDLKPPFNHAARDQAGIPDAYYC